jgi:hypothetical protein
VSYFGSKPMRMTLPVLPLPWRARYLVSIQKYK